MGPLFLFLALLYTRGFRNRRAQDECTNEGLIKHPLAKLDAVKERPSAAKQIAEKTSLGCRKLTSGAKARTYFQ